MNNLKNHRDFEYSTLEQQIDAYRQDKKFGVYKEISMLSLRNEKFNLQNVEWSKLEGDHVLKIWFWNLFPESKFNVFILTRARKSQNNRNQNNWCQSIFRKLFIQLKYLENLYFLLFYFYIKTNVYTKNHSILLSIINYCTIQ